MRYTTLTLLCLFAIPAWANETVDEGSEVMPLSLEQASDLSGEHAAIDSDGDVPPAVRAASEGDSAVFAPPLTVNVPLERTSEPRRLFFAVQNCEHDSNTDSAWTPWRGTETLFANPLVASTGLALDWESQFCGQPSAEASLANSGRNSVAAISQSGAYQAGLLDVDTVSALQFVLARPEARFAVRAIARHDFKPADVNGTGNIGSEAETLKRMASDAQEIGQTAVPAPGSLALVWAGGIGISVMAGHRRRS